MRLEFPTLKRITMAKKKALQIRDRIKDFRRVKASDLKPSPHNWRKHTDKQKSVIAAVLERIGFAGAELTRELPDGSLELIDGHARAEIAGDTVIPVLVTDLTESEAKEVLATFDAIGSMAETDEDLLQSLVDELTFEEDPINELLESLLPEIPTEELIVDEKSANEFSRIIIDGLKIDVPWDQMAAWSKKIRRTAGLSDSEFKALILKKLGIDKHAIPKKTSTKSTNPPAK